MSILMILPWYPGLLYGCGSLIPQKPSCSQHQTLPRTVNMSNTTICISFSSFLAIKKTKQSLHIHVFMCIQYIDPACRI